MGSLSKINVGLRFANIIGFGLALYSFFVGSWKKRDPSYIAMCDINDYMSCSKVFTSKYGKGFGLLHNIVGEDSAFNVSNSVGGMIFFITFFILSFWDTITVSTLLLRLSVGSIICCVYLAYILYFVLHDFCVVCISTYVVSGVNLALCAAKVRLLRDLDSVGAKHD